jgi:hypothetical protein
MFCRVHHVRYLFATAHRHTGPKTPILRPSTSLAATSAQEERQHQKRK